MMSALVGNVSSSPGPENANVSALVATPGCSLCCCSLLSRTLTVVFMVSLTIAIIAGNMVTLIVLMQTRQGRTPQGYLKVSLALADMMVGVLVVPFSVYTEISLLLGTVPPGWFLGDPGKSSAGPWQPCRLIGPVFAGCTFVSISTIFLMTLERSVAILRPLHKDFLVTRRRTLLFILVSWAGSFLLALAPLCVSDGFTLEYNACSRMCNYMPLRANIRPPSDGSVLLLFPAFDFTLLGSTLAINVLSFTSIRRYTHKRRLLSEGGPRAEGCCHRPSFSDIKAAKTIGILTFAFATSFLPIAVFVLGNVVGHSWCSFSFIAFWMLTANSCCNVVIYSMRDRRFCRGVTLLFRHDRPPLLEEKS